MKKGDTYRKSSNASFMCASMCVFFQFERLLSAFLLIYIFQKNDKTERGAAACWRLHPGSVASVYSLIFQSFKRRSRSLHNTKIHNQTGCIYSDACAALSPWINAREASGGRGRDEDIIKGGSDMGARFQYIPSLAVIVWSGFWQMVLSHKYTHMQSMFYDAGTKLKHW